MKSLNFENCKLLHVFALFMVTFTFVSSENEFLDIDLPKYDDAGDYNQYHFRPPTRYGQIKLDPELFYQSIFNPEYQKLPHPHSHKDFLTYMLAFRTPKEIFKLDYIQAKRSEAKQVENQRLPDFRYLGKSGVYNLETNPKYFQSNILKAKEEMLNKHSTNWYSVNEIEFQNITTEFLLYPKLYELDGIEFSDARLQLGILLQHITPGITNPVSSTRNLEAINPNIYINMKSLFLIKNERYEDYIRRLAYYEFVPLPKELCIQFYQATFNTSSPDPEP